MQKRYRSQEVKAHDRHWRGGDGQHPAGCAARVIRWSKRHRWSLCTAQTVCAGKYIVVVSGEVAAVRSAVAAGVESAASALVDSLVIANVDERVVAAMAGACPVEQVLAVGVMETFSLASSISAADTAVKAADVELIEVRLGRGMGGKSFVIVTGEVAAVEAAVQAAEGSEQTQGLISSSVVIPSPHMDIIRALL